MSASRTPELTDFDLVAAYRQGDERAATELVRRHAGAIGRFLYLDPVQRAKLLIFRERLLERVQRLRQEGGGGPRGRRRPLMER